MLGVRVVKKVRMTLIQLPLSSMFLHVFLNVFKIQSLDCLVQVVKTSKFEQTFFCSHNRFALADAFSQEDGEFTFWMSWDDFCARVSQLFYFRSDYESIKRSSVLRSATRSASKSPSPSPGP